MIGDICPSDNWYYPRPCTPGLECYGIRSLHGPSTFFVLTSNLPTWLNELRAIVDFGKLGIKLIVSHNSVPDQDLQLTQSIRFALKTERDPNDREAQLPKGGPIDNQKQREFPSTDSSLFWILTTWNTWQGISKAQFIE